MCRQWAGTGSEAELMPDRPKPVAAKQNPSLEKSIAVEGAGKVMAEMSVRYRRGGDLYVPSTE